jgi:hypothetical protein
VLGKDTLSLRRPYFNRRIRLKRPEDQSTMSDIPPHQRRLRGWRLFLVIGLAGAGLYGWLAIRPSYSFSLLCTYDVTYRVTGTIEVDGARYSSTATHQQSRSREWVQQINSAGCQQTHGTVLSFRLPDDRVVLAGTGICSRALREMSDTKKDYPRSYTTAMREGSTVDVGHLCRGIGRDPNYKGTSPDGFVIDHADRPGRWEGFRFGEKLATSDTVINLASASATAMDISPSDDLDKVAPGLLDASFEYRNWSASPDVVIPFFRRYKKSQEFKYKVRAVNAADASVTGMRAP